MTKIWEVEYGSFTRLNVEAANAKEAMRKAMWKRHGEPYNRLQDITSVSLQAEAD